MWGFVRKIKDFGTRRFNTENNYSSFSRARRNELKEKHPEIGGEERKKMIDEEWEQKCRERENYENRMLLNRDFYLQDTLKVAYELLGKVIEHQTPEGTIAVIINETEAYTDYDPGSISYKGKKTTRSSWMFTDGGNIFLYKSMGIHLIWNIITETPDRGCGVLVRGCIHLRGTEFLNGIEKVKNVLKAMDGPGKVTKKLRIPMEYNGTSIIHPDSPIKIYDEGYIPQNVKTTTRINVPNDLPWRFVCNEFLKNNEIYP
ncbi:unnamed protein product [Blepharisma stoltei]|uniref:DNA-3-methyladenine glycosylase II n=1 Tax=Blepharisma stoltei TaxID=1481888 RepID=A0AAU9JTT1_9CILI|nr:unnamed protein product [Blepharisma stoltei]